MPEWIIAFIGLVVGASLVILHSLSKRPRYIVRSARVPEYDRSPSAILSRMYSCPKDRITIRPLIPGDIDKTSWEWRDNEAIKTPSYRLLELTGIDCGRWAAVSIFNNEIGSTRIGLLTSWDNSASVIIEPQEKVFLRQMEVGGEKSEHFALKGKVYEPEGAYII